MELSRVVLDLEIVLIQYTNNLILHIKISYKLDKNNSISIGSKFKRGDSQYNLYWCRDIKLIFRRGLCLS